MKSPDALVQFRKLLAELEKEKAALERRLAEINEVLSATKGSKPHAAKAVRSGKRNMSAAGRKRIADAQKARWAKFHAQQAKAAK